MALRDIQSESVKVVLIRKCKLLLLGVLVTSTIAFAGRKHEEENGPAARLSKAPASAQALKNPFAGQAETIISGRKLFHKHCIDCHGPDGRGIGHAADLRAPIIQNASPGVLLWAIRNGNPRKGMPAWSSYLKDQQLWQIITFIKTLNNPKGGE